jgi:hypothetical protein
MWHMSRRPLLALTVCLMASALPVTAQEPTETPAGPGEAPLTASRAVEIGVGVGGDVSFVGNGGDLRITVSVPRGARRSIEGFAGVYRGNDVFKTRGVYGFQIRQQMARGRRPRFEPFATFGLMGIVVRYQTSDCSYASCRPYTSTHVLPPFLGLAGVGAQYAVTPHLAVRLEWQAAIALVIPVGVRMAAGVSIPLGRVTSDSRIASR